MGIVIHDAVRQRLLACFEAELNTLTDPNNYTNLTEFMRFTKTEEYVSTVDMLNKKIAELRNAAPQVTGAMDEAHIRVNGHWLTNGQSLAVRVAIGSYMMDLSNNVLGEDERGQKMNQLYLARLEEVMHYILEKR